MYVVFVLRIIQTLADSDPLVRAPNAPLVFCHGLLGFDSVTIGPAVAPLQVSHWRGIKEALEAYGCEVLITRVPATSSPVDRAKVLEKKISETYPGRDVHLISHSMVRFPSPNFHHLTRVLGWYRLSLSYYPPHPTHLPRSQPDHNCYTTSWLFFCFPLPFPCLYSPSISPYSPRASPEWRWRWQGIRMSH